MAHTELKHFYTLSLTNEEYRLVTMSLAGMIKDKEDVAKAKQLNENLCQQRVTQTEQAHTNATKALDTAKKIASDQPKET